MVVLYVVIAFVVGVVFSEQVKTKVKALVTKYTAPKE